MEDIWEEFKTNLTKAYFRNDAPRIINHLATLQITDAESLTNYFTSEKDPFPEWWKIRNLLYDCGVRNIIGSTATEECAKIVVATTTKTRQERYRQKKAKEDKAIANYDQLQEENTELKRQNATLRHNLDNQTDNLKNAEGRIDVLRQDCVDLQRSVCNLERERDKLLSQVEELKKKKLIPDDAPAHLRWELLCLLQRYGITQ